MHCALCNQICVQVGIAHLRSHAASCDQQLCLAVGLKHFSRRAGDSCDDSVLKLVQMMNCAKLQIHGKRGRKVQGRSTHTLSQTAPATNHWQPSLPALTGTAAAEVRQHQHICPTRFVRSNEGEESGALPPLAAAGKDGWSSYHPPVAPFCTTQRAS